MDVSIKKVGEVDGVEQFILVNSITRKVLTAREANETAIRRFFEQLGADGHLIDTCLETARTRFDNRHELADSSFEEAGEDDLLFELGLDEDDL